MTTTTPSEGPFGPDTDEAVSALLDGELAAFAADHGLSETDARARLDAWPELGTRRSALQGARDAVAAPAAPLDDLTRRRLVRTARREGPAPADAPRSRSRMWTAIGAVAAGVLVIAGVGLAINASSDRGSDSAQSSAGDSAATRASLEGEVGDLGDVTDPAVLRALLDGTAPPSVAGGAEAPATGESTPAPDLGATQDGTDNAVRRQALSPDDCATQLAGDRVVAFVGTGTFRGAPVTIVGLTERGRTIAFVVSSTDCTDILTSLSR